VTAEPESSRGAEHHEQSSRGPRLGLITALAILAGVVIVIIYGYLERPGWIGSSGKQFWDYLDLLIVPAALAFGVYWLNRRQSERDQQAEDAQQQRALAVESQRAQDEALQAYLDQMAQLLIEHPLRRASPGDNLSTVARARTLTVLTRLDRNRKGSVLQFLYESDLIERQHNIVSLQQADLFSADLIRANLREANLSGADLHNAYLREADLEGADLRGANLSGANLHGAHLEDAQLSKASLNGANLHGAHLARASLIGATLRKANLRNANLSETFLVQADLREAVLTSAFLSGASLGGANLSRASLTAALGWTLEQSIAADSLEGATMPTGQKYEDWIKTIKIREGKKYQDLLKQYEDMEKQAEDELNNLEGDMEKQAEDELNNLEGRGEGGENSGPS
jgi:uncharacterized protein YjbI with pentapeptide repeats